MQLKLLRKDQYGRAVCKVETGLQIFPPFTRKDVSIELIRRGLASVYTGGGAEYDGNRAVFETKEAEAKRKKLGLWSQGDNVVSPAEFKRQYRQKVEQQGKMEPSY